ncbi:15974_t:CDS:2, partial [Dentiscutata erythropus]
GIGGLSFYHSVRKNLGKKFNVKIFDCEIGPQDRWQGYNRKSVTSLFYCTPPEVQVRFPEAMPDPIPQEHQSTAIIDHVGRHLIYASQQKTKNVYEIETLKHNLLVYDDGVWALFEDGTRELGDLLIHQVPNLEILNLGVTSIDVDIAVPKKFGRTIDVCFLRCSGTSDSAHAMNPVLALGANNAIQNANLLTKELLYYEKDNLIACIQRYNKKMRARSSKDVMKSRNFVLRERNQFGNLGLIARYSIYR